MCAFMQVRRKLAQLSKEYTHVRVLRSDGNELYRGIVFALLESAILSQAPGRIGALAER